MRVVVGSYVPDPPRVVALADATSPPLHAAEGYAFTEQADWLCQPGEKTLGGWRIGPWIETAIAGLPAEVRIALVSSLPTEWQGYRLLYIPGKLLEMRRGRTARRGTSQKWTLYDLSGFWPSGAPLTTVAARWGVAGPTWTGYDAAVMTEWRGVSLEQIATATADRAALLHRLMDAARPALQHYGLTPRSWHGAGALGSLILGHANATTFVARYRPDRGPICDETAILPLMQAAYYGGRQETTVAGSWTLPTYRYDLRAAYPWALSWVGAAGYLWEVATRWSDALEDRMSLWYVRWNLGPGSLGPFPYRQRNGSIAYPLSGAGWYWWPEVRAARRAYGSACIRVLAGYRAERSVRRPFLRTMDHYWQIRRQAEADRRPEVVELLKGGMAAVYGKLAQQVGSGGQPGRWYHPGLAGWVTSAVRGRLIDAWAGHEGSIVSVNTDGMMTTKLLPVQPGDGLGAWRVETWDAVTMVLPGLYRLTAETPSGPLVEQASTGVASLDFDWLLDRLQGVGQATIRSRWFAPNLLADLFPDQWETRRCRWIGGSTTINPYRIAHKRDGAEATRVLDWRHDIAAFPAYASLGTADSAAHPGPPAWESDHLDVTALALSRIMQGK